MKATKVTIPPVPVEPVTEVTITMSLKEAKLLLIISTWNISVPRAIASQMFDRQAATEMLGQLYKVLSGAGVEG